MSTNELLGALFLAFFAGNTLLSRSAGLDSAERFSRDPKRVWITAAVLTVSSVIADIVSYAVLIYVLPVVGLSSSTLLDGTVIVLSVLAGSSCLELAADRFMPSLKERFGGEIFSIFFNSATVGIVLLCRAYSKGFVGSLADCVIISASLAVMLYLVSVWRVTICEHRLDGIFRGAPIYFILLGLAAMVLEGYSGIMLPL